MLTGAVWVCAARSTVSKQVCLGLCSDGVGVICVLVGDRWDLPGGYDLATSMHHKGLVLQPPCTARV